MKKVALVKLAEIGICFNLSDADQKFPQAKSPKIKRYNDLK